MQVRLAIEFAVAPHLHTRLTAAQQLTAFALADLDEMDSTVLSEVDVAAARVSAVLPVAGRALQLGDAESAHSWLVQGLGGSAAKTSEISTAGVVELLRLASGGDPGAQDVVAYFMSVFLPLNQHAGYLAEIRDPLADHLIRALLHMPPFDAACDAACAALSWANSNKRAELIEPLSAWCNVAAGQTTVFERKVALMFAVAVSQTGSRRANMLQALSANLPNALSAGLRMQIVLAALESSALTARDLERALEAIDSFWEEASGALGTAELARLRQRGFGVVGSLITMLTRAGAAYEALRVLRHWIGVTDDAAPSDCLLLTHEPDGTRYTWPGGSFLSAPPANALHLDQAVNSALGLALASSWDPGRLLVAPATGKPDRTAGKALEAACREAFGPADAPWTTKLTVETLLVPMPGHRIPYQALVADYTDQCPPLWTSLRQPLNEAWPQRVALLEGDTDLASIEAALVSDILGGAGIDVIHLRPSETTTSAFFDHYRDPAVDVLWLICHGHNPPYDPDLASLVLREGEEVEASRLASNIPERNEQRLLVLNSCDGAATRSTGGLRARGLAAEAAGPAQAVVAHQWEVDDRLAATFGALLACALVEHQGHRAAFNVALRWLRRPWAEIELVLETHDAKPELVKSLKPVTSSYADNILDWGAPALYF